MEDLILSPNSPLVTKIQELQLQTSNNEKQLITWGGDNITKGLTPMAAYGPNQWFSKPSLMAKTGYPFSWDINQNIILPANLKLTINQETITLEDYIKNIINT